MVTMCAARRFFGGLRSFLADQVTRYQYRTPGTSEPTIHAFSPLAYRPTPLQLGDFPQAIRTPIRSIESPEGPDLNPILIFHPPSPFFMPL